MSDPWATPAADTPKPWGQPSEPSDATAAQWTQAPALTPSPVGAFSSTGSVPRSYGYPPRPWPPGSDSQAVEAAGGGSYTRVLLSPPYAWWRPLAGFSFFTAVYIAAALALFVVPGFLLAATGDSTDPLSDEGSPAFFLLGNLSLALLIPVAMLTVWVVHRRKPGILSSVVGRLRWRLLAQCLGIATGVVLLSFAVSFFLPAGESDTADADYVGASRFLILLAIIAVTTPLQAAGEEYAFRGYFMQAIGAWAKSWVWVPVVVTSLLFAFAHGQQDPALFTDRFLFGVTAAILTIRTGGLEAAIGLHVVNNVLALGVAALFSDFGDTLTASNAPWSLVIVDIVQLGLYVLLVEAITRGRVQRTTLRWPILR